MAFGERFALGSIVLGCTLMDMSPDAAMPSRVNEDKTKNATGSIEAHDPHAREAGRLIFLDFHLVVPGAMSVGTSHAICDRIEAALMMEMTDLAITIHVEAEDKAQLHRPGS